MGLTENQLLWRVEVPLALPEIFAGVRIATTTTVGLATLAFFAGAGGLGALIFGDLVLQVQRRGRGRAVHRCWPSSWTACCSSPSGCRPHGSGRRGHDPRRPSTSATRSTSSSTGASRSPAACRSAAASCCRCSGRHLELTARPWASRARSPSRSRCGSGTSRKGQFAVVSICQRRPRGAEPRAASASAVAYIGLGFPNVVLALDAAGHPADLHQHLRRHPPGRARHRRRRPRHGHDRARDRAACRAPAGRCH